ncbi:hypothetical protein [Streptomyces pacificus]|uniref:Uncharacterized protein n=1 Tax=Streptomyces pacificus TaxID=2705029 RepID=A0A6A0AT04_9ACTN|nr:hypothetical protein [Streptomyces pacificus]GFH35453.1 hypothetical protein SCWH03_16690 [Streptomyces pacificus]
MTAVPVDERTWLIGRIGSEEVASEVAAWWLDEEGVNPLTAGEWTGCREGEIFKGTRLDAAKVAMLRKLAEVAERCKTPEALADLDRIAEWVTNWKPGDPGLSLGGVGNGG